MHKDAAQLLRSFPELKVSFTKRHVRITNPSNGDFVIASMSPSDCRFLRNLRRDLRLLRLGRGYMYFNRSRFHH